MPRIHVLPCKVVDQHLVQLERKDLEVQQVSSSHSHINQLFCQSPFNTTPLLGEAREHQAPE